MNRKNKILVGCLALLLALSVGYALFSDTITINGTATAKGSFDITATCETGIASKLGTVESLGLSTEGGFENDKCSVVDDTVSLSTNFLYPGARRYFTVKETNNGTIDAVYNDSEIEVSQNICVADNIEGENKGCDSLIGINTGEVVSSGPFAGYFHTNFMAVEDPNGNLLSDEQILELYDSATGNITLKPGYSFYNRIMLSINHAGTGFYNAAEFFVEYSVTIKHPFKQVTQ